MGRTGPTPIIELSPEAYGEIEKQLLHGGYYWLFERGPGSDIDMGQFKVRLRIGQAARDIIGMARAMAEEG